MVPHCISGAEGNEYARACQASSFLGPYEVTNVDDDGRYDERSAVDAEGRNGTSTICDNIKLWRYVAKNGSDTNQSRKSPKKSGRNLSRQRKREITIELKCAEFTRTLISYIYKNILFSID